LVGDWFRLVWVWVGVGVGVPWGLRVRPLLENCIVDASIPDVQYWFGRLLALLGVGC